MKKPVLVMVSGRARSLTNFRGQLINRYIESGYDLHAVAPDFNSHPATCEQLNSWGVKMHKIRMSRAGINPLLDIVSLVQLFFVFKKIKPEVVFLYNIKPVIYGLVSSKLAARSRRYAMITGLGYAFVDGKGRGRRAIQKIVSRLYSKSLRMADIVFFQNKDDELYFRKAGILAASAETKIINGSGVDLDYFQFSPPVVEPTKFLMIGRLLGDKGFREYVRAARLVKEENPEVEFYVVGGLDENPNSIKQEELSEWIDSGLINYVGPVEDVRPYIDQSSVFVLPSYREGTPRTVLEAMAMGRPIITTDAPGCKETVVDGLNGYLIPVKDHILLAKKMRAFTSNPALIEKMGMESRRLAKEKYDVHKVNDVILGLTLR